MGFFDAFKDSHDDVHHRGSLTHDALGGAVAYEAAKAYEDYLAANGKPDSHAKAKEVLAGLAGVAFTRLAETKGLDAYDSYKQQQIQKKAQEHLEREIAREYNY